MAEENTNLEGREHIPILTLIEGFLDQLAADGRSVSTIKTYRNTLNIYADWLDKPVVEVTPTDVREFAVRPRPKAPEGAKATTRRRDIVTVRLFHQWAAEEGFGVPTVNSVRTPKVIPGGPNPLHDDVWRRIWLSDLDPSDRLWIGMGYYLGLRKSEIVTMQPEAVDNPSDGLIRFRRKGGRFAPIRYVQMVEDVADQLPWLGVNADSWLDQFQREAARRVKLSANFLWWDAEGDVVNDGNRLNKRLSRVMKVMEIQRHQATPHRLRHSCATNLLRAGWQIDQVKVALSHSSIDITQQYADYAALPTRG